MKKIWLASAFATVMLALSACGGAQTAADATAQNTEEGDVLNSPAFDEAPGDTSEGATEAPSNAAAK